MRTSKELYEIAQDMVDWCLVRGCQQLGDTEKEVQLTCPNFNCPSRTKGENHRSFDINKHTALYHCWHCGLKGIGLEGPKGLITQLGNGNFIPSSIIIDRTAYKPPNFFKPKEIIDAKPIMSREEVGKARAKGLCDEAVAYLTRRGIPEHVFKDFDYLIFSQPAGKQLSFMKQPLSDKAIFFPKGDDKGEIIYVTYKLLRGGYYNSPGRKPIYLTKNTASNLIVVVEGIFDALSVYTVGYRGAALLGHEITSNHDLSIFEGKNVVLMLDNDDVGQLSVEKVATTLAIVAKEVRIAEIPADIDGHKIKDANDVLVNAGVEKLSELITEAKVYSGSNQTVDYDYISDDTLSSSVESQTDIAEEKKAASDETGDNAEVTITFEMPDAETLRELLNFHHTDVGNAQAFALLFGDRFRFDWKRKRWLYFDDIRWQMDGNLIAMQAAKHVARARLAAAAIINDDDKKREKAAKWALSSESLSRLNGALELSQSEPPLPASTEKFDTDSYLLGCANGVIDLKKGEIRPGRQEDYITKSTHIAYNDNAECPRWIQFLNEVFLENSELIGFIRKAIGYSLTGDISEQCLFICYGTGWNGKSKFLTTLRLLLGDYARNTPFSTFTQRYRDTTTNDLAALAGVRLVTSSEIGEGQRLNEARVKAMTGGDPITARFLYGEYFDYIPAYKVWLAVNHKPVIKGTDEGIWRRIRLIPFEASFKANPDPYLEEKLKAEIEGILRWALVGCLEWQEERLEIAEKVKSATDEYRQESDVIAQFLTECTIESENAKVKASELYKAYEEWCETSGEEAISGTAFGRRMREKGYDKTRITAGWHYTRIGLLTEDI